ncbi:hypothetical protein E3P89_00903 [Wallemia ichthyophaga]|uniref:Glycosidase crf2 n=2 Tax=Wallemia ichthyophaga TaxID=245174 RepID=A0A4T0HFN6_WALIC|nr:putative glycosidase CRH2 [Wallemia ichthyophaga EXF-994]TIA92449.1 hypothetical protein E3P97_01466 [Wallemia ichthyophaga]EOR00327.1 putative glycosidase CRH2 [Wallemia ichthyophaga EXF-994]TIA99364.1 hypothetical protein E3P96_02932 [Wallemia ichthyophaga]TIB01490.1 hypothetical protein E3P95_01302 [Wallemia ichthyophaga]TIB02440.1 hypothetical protein E3P94_01434 [Wallemia ichthyophaga]
MYNAKRAFSLGALFALAATTAAANGGSCSAATGLTCPTDIPCCSEFGHCGDTNAHCRFGCDPRVSAQDACENVPMCKNLNINAFDRLAWKGIMQNPDEYHGEADEYDFTLDKGDIAREDNMLTMIMTEDNKGTKLSSTRYMLYGEFNARMKVTGNQGVISTMILMSDIHDEIDWEFVGAKTGEGQSNYYFQGETDYTKGDTHDFPHPDERFHDFGLNWTEEKLEWKIDGVVVRTLNKADTMGWDKVPHYPASPSRLQFSVWPSGIEDVSPGSYEWGGGAIHWDEGPFKATIQSVSIKCADSPTNVGPDDVSWKYTMSEGNATSLGQASFHPTSEPYKASSGGLSLHVSSPFTLMATLTFALVYCTF